MIYSFSTQFDGKFQLYSGKITRKLFIIFNGSFIISTTLKIFF